MPPWKRLAESWQKHGCSPKEELHWRGLLNPLFVKPHILCSSLLANWEQPGNGSGSCWGIPAGQIKSHFQKPTATFFHVRLGRYDNWVLRGHMTRMADGAVFFQSKVCPLRCNKLIKLNWSSWCFFWASQHFSCSLPILPYKFCMCVYLSVYI